MFNNEPTKFYIFDSDESCFGCQKGKVIVMPWTLWGLRQGLGGLGILQLRLLEVQPAGAVEQRWVGGQG